MKSSGKSVKSALSLILTFGLTIYICGTVFAENSATESGSATESAPIEGEVDPNYVPPTIYESGDFCYYIQDDKETVIISDYIGESKDVVIPAVLDGYRVAAVGMEAFSYVKMNSLVVSEGIETLKMRSFEYCEVKESLSLPENIVIEKDAFSYAFLPETLRIPAGVSVNNRTFAYLKNTTTIVIEPGVTVEKNAFEYGKELLKVVCGEGVILKDNTFYGCTILEEVLLCGEVTLEDEPFNDCPKARITNGDAEDIEQYL